MWNVKKAAKLEQLEREVSAMKEDRDNALEALQTTLVQVLVATLGSGRVDGMSREAIASGFIKNADKLRDALEPFDSGTRAMSPRDPLANVRQPWEC